MGSCAADFPWVLTDHHVYYKLLRYMNDFSIQVSSPSRDELLVHGLN